MIRPENDFKNNLQIIKKDQSDSESRKKRNATNKFLNANFKVMVFVFIIAFMVIAFQFFILPKFREASTASNTIIEAKKIEFINEYNNLQNYKNLINEFSKVDPQNIYKVEKMVPNAYTRDDLFTEVTYFLIQNGFKINSINIIDPTAEVAKTTNGTKRAGTDENVSKPAYQGKITALPGNVSAWVINLEIVSLDYPKLKSLLNLLESNLKLMDVYSLDFYPASNSLNIGLITYYNK